MKLTTHQVCVAGEHYVAAEIYRRGGYASPSPRNMPHIDIVACDVDQQRRIDIHVKTKNHPGRWAGNIRDGAPRQEPSTEDRFWVLVDLSENAPQFYGRASLVDAKPYSRCLSGISRQAWRAATAKPGQHRLRSPTK